jgi:hypothetical protein
LYDTQNNETTNGIAKIVVELCQILGGKLPKHKQCLKKYAIEGKLNENISSTDTKEENT